MLFRKQDFKASLLMVVLFIFMQKQCFCQETDSLNKKDKVKINAPVKMEVVKKGDSINVDKLSKQPIIVQRVYNINRKDFSDKHLDSAGIGDIIVVEVSNLDSLLKRSKTTGQKIRLFINGRKIENIEPISGAPQKDDSTLQYRLDRNLENNKIWTDILGAPPLLGAEFFVKEVKISVGLENEYASNTLSAKNNFEIIRIHKGWFWSCFFMTIIYVLTIILMAKKRGLLRDRGLDLTAININSNSSSNSYSLGRVQMAFWFTLTIISFFFIWLITDAYDIITPTILALIGISAGTSLSAVIIDNSKSTELLNQTIILQNEKNNLDAEILDLDNQIKVVPSPGNLSDIQFLKKSKEVRRNEIMPVLKKNIIVLTPQKSEGFFNDILMDVNGVSFHRLQMVVWTVVLGMIFLYSVWKSLSMPEFSATLLALQGLTAGTYLGFKFPEKQA